MIRHTTKKTGGLELKKQAEGTLNADGSEQSIVKINSLMKLSGYIDLSEMETGDEVVIKQYMRIKSGGAYKKYAQENYSGVQEKPLIYITTKVLGHGGQVTLQQTLGTNKSFEYEFISEE